MSRARSPEIPGARSRGFSRSMHLRRPWLAASVASLLLPRGGYCGERLSDDCVRRRFFNAMLCSFACWFAIAGVMSDDGISYLKDEENCAAANSRTQVVQINYASLSVQGIAFATQGATTVEAFSAPTAFRKGSRSRATHRSRPSVQRSLRAGWGLRGEAETPLDVPRGCG